MAPERIFQGRQRGILGLVGGKDTCNPPPNQISPPEPCDLNSKRRLLPCSAPLFSTRDGSTSQALSSSCPSPSSRNPRTFENPHSARGAAPPGRRGPCPPLQLPVKVTLDPLGSGSGKRPRCAGARASARVYPPRAPSRLPYRCGPRVVGSFRPDDPARLGSARQRRCALGGGADALAARAQRAAPGSARAGGGCYARNVRVSGSPSGSKRTTNNLLARRPPPPPPVCSSRPPPSSREAVLSAWRAAGP